MGETVFRESDFPWIVILSHLVIVPLSICLYVYHVNPGWIFEGTTIAVVLSFAISLYSGVVQRFAGFEFLKSYILFWHRFGRWAAVVQILAALGCVIWMVAIFGNFVDRFRYVRIVEQSLSQNDLGTLVVPQPEDLARAFSLFPGRREVPFLIARASRTLAFTDDYRFFAAFMRKFVAALDMHRVRRFLRETDAATAAGVRIFLANTHVQASYDHKGLGRAIHLLDSVAKPTGQEQLVLSILTSERDFGVLNGELLAGTFDRERRAPLLRQMRGKADSLAAFLRGGEARPDGDVYDYATSHAYQQALDSLAQLNFALVAGTTDGKEKARRIDAAITAYIRVLTLRNRLVSKGSVLWFSAPGTLTVHHYFQQRSGTGNRTSETWMKILARIDPGIGPELDRRLLNASGFAKFRSVDFWELGTPLADDFRGTKSKDLMQSWLKEDW